MNILAHILSNPAPSHARESETAHLKRLQERLGALLPDLCIQRPYPDERFHAKHPR